MLLIAAVAAAIGCGAPGPAESWVTLDPTLTHDSTNAPIIRTNAQGGAPNYYLVDPFSRHVFTTDAPYIITESIFDVDTLPTTGSSADIGWASTGVLVNGVPQGDGAHGIAYGPSVRQRYALPGGTVTIELINGPGTHLTPGAALRGMPTVAVGFPFGSHWSAVSPTAPAKRVLVKGPSIADGAKVTTGPNASSTYQGTWMVARGNMKASVTGALAGAQVTTSTASQEKWFDFADVSVRAADITKIGTELDGTSANYIVYDGLETNDWGASLQTASAFQTMIGDYLDAVHAAYPSAKVVVVTAIAAFLGGTANGQGATLADLRAAVSAAATARSSFVTLINGVPLVSTPNLLPDSHPTTAGQAEKEVNLRAALVSASLGY